MGAFFGILRLSFDYPAVMGLPAPEVLSRIGRASDGVVAAWLGVTLSTVLFLAVVVGFDRVLREEAGGNDRLARRLPWLALITTFGVFATLCMMLDLSQWVWLYPDLGRRFVDPATTPATGQNLVVLWTAFHHYVGEGIGVYGATFFNALWALGVGWILTVARPRRVLPWLALAAGALFLLSIAPGETFDGYSRFNELGFLPWALWLVLTGWALVRGRPMAADGQPRDA